MLLARRQKQRFQDSVARPRNKEQIQAELRIQILIQAA